MVLIELLDEQNAAKIELVKPVRLCSGSVGIQKDGRKVNAVYQIDSRVNRDEITRKFQKMFPDRKFSLTKNEKLKVYELVVYCKEPVIGAPKQNVKQPVQMAKAR